MSNEGQISEDGMWRWDGQRWVPNTPGPPQAPPPPPRKRHTGRNIGIGCGGALAAVVALIVILVAVNSGGSGSKTNTSSSPGKQSSGQQASCKQPCAQAGGVTLAVSNVNPNAQPSQYSQVPAGNSLVTVTAVVTNQSSSSPPLVNPFDFKLQDSQGTQHSFAPVTVDGCSNSSVNVAKGGTSGPQCMVFEVPQGQTTGLTLLWQNHSDLFGGQMQVKVS